MDWTIESATRSDLATIRALLEASGLSADRVTEAQFLVARRQGRAVGCIGVEISDETAMLRSLAVAFAHREKGLGGALVDAVRERARRSGCSRVIALTVDASAFFSRLGFRIVSRESLDTQTLAHWQFSAGVCESAVCLELPLVHPSDATAIH